MLLNQNSEADLQAYKLLKQSPSAGNIMSSSNIMLESPSGKRLETAFNNKNLEKHKGFIL
jgi:hypothetical protein